LDRNLAIFIPKANNFLISPFPYSIKLPPEEKPV